MAVALAVLVYLHSARERAALLAAQRVIEAEWRELLRAGSVVEYARAQEIKARAKLAVANGAPEPRRAESPYAGIWRKPPPPKETP